MAVKIRLTRTGRRNKPFHRLGAYDTRARRDGKAIENLGHYDPYATTDENKYKFNAERIQYWLSVGAQPSASVAPMLKRLKIEKPTAVTK